MSAEVITSMHYDIASMHRCGNARNATLNPATRSTSSASGDANAFASAFATAAIDIASSFSATLFCAGRVSPTSCSHEGQETLDLIRESKVQGDGDEEADEILILMD